MRYDFKYMLPAAAATSLLFGGALLAESPGPGKLSRHRLAALGQAVRVDRLSNAYRVDGTAGPRRETAAAVMNGAPAVGLEPGRLPTIVSARPIAPFGSPPAVANRGATLSHFDDQVRPSVWIDDRASVPATQPVASVVVPTAATAPSELNPLRRAATYSSGASNPLRDDR